MCGLQLGDSDLAGHENLGRSGSDLACGSAACDQES